MILQVASWVLWVEKFYFTSYQLLFASWNFKTDKFTSWQLKMIIFMSRNVIFYKLNIYDANFTNYHHMFESNFKGINLRKLCQEAILIKCFLTLERYVNITRLKGTK